MKAAYALFALLSVFLFAAAVPASDPPQGARVAQPVNLPHPGTQLPDGLVLAHDSLIPGPKSQQKMLKALFDECAGCEPSYEDLPMVPGPYVAHSWTHTIGIPQTGAPPFPADCYLTIKGALPGECDPEDDCLPHLNCSISDPEITIFIGPNQTPFSWHCFVHVNGSSAMYLVHSIDDQTYWNSETYGNDLAPSVPVSYGPGRQYDSYLGYFHEYGCGNELEFRLFKGAGTSSDPADEFLQFTIGCTYCSSLEGRPEQSMFF